MAVNPNFPAPLTQTYTYHGANRLKTAQESESWSRVYDYDAYGNRWVEGANHILTFATPTASSQFNAANNRISQNFNGQGTPPAYDAAGNLTSHLHIGAMAYDAENHQTSFTGASGTTTYQYDGDGRRGQSRFAYSASISSAVITRPVSARSLPRKTEKPPRRARRRGPGSAATTAEGTPSNRPHRREEEEDCAPP